MKARVLDGSWVLLGFALAVAAGCGGTVRTTGGRADGDGGGSGYGGYGTANTSGGGGKSGAAGLGGRGGKGGSAGFCSSGYTFCGGACVDLATDLANCGQCFSFCDGICDGGACVTTQACAPGTTWCQDFGQCLNLENNGFACGSCYSPCEGAQVCSGGKCQPGQCLPGYTWCDVPTSGTHCLDVTTDRNNCGACGNVCGGTFSYGAYDCASGTCACAPDAIPCGKACASQFWYCPSSVSSSTPEEQCLARARNSYEACACKSCLDTVTACADSPSCVNAMDCSLGTLCVGCGSVFSDCSDSDGRFDATAQKLVQCVNDKCQVP